MYSVCDTRLMTGGFPHSDISGSKVVCHLPEAFRRLPRLSSPLTAKASTVCAYSLDHITPNNLMINDNPELALEITSYLSHTQCSDTLRMSCHFYHFPKLLKSD